MYRGNLLIRNRNFENTRCVSHLCFLFIEKPARDWQSPGNNHEETQQNARPLFLYCQESHTSKTPCFLCEPVLMFVICVEPTPEKS